MDALLCLTLTSCWLGLPACLLLPLPVSFLNVLAMMAEMVCLMVCQGVIHVTVQQVLHRMT